MRILDSLRRNNRRLLTAKITLWVNKTCTVNFFLIFNEYVDYKNAVKYFNLFNIFSLIKLYVKHLSAALLTPATGDWYSHT